MAKGHAAVCADWSDISSRVSLCIFHGDSAESVLLLRIRHGRTGCVFARKSAGQAGRAEKKTRRLCFIFSHLPPPAPGAGGHPVWPVRELHAVCVLGPHQIPVSANYTTDLTYCILSSFFSAELNTQTLFPWKTSLKANHTSTLSCSCEYSYFLAPSVLLFLFSPTHCESHARSCVLQHTCGYIWQLLVGAGEQRLTRT